MARPIRIDGGALNHVTARGDRREPTFEGVGDSELFLEILVDSDNYLLELARSVVLNPVRAGMVDAPADWPWSSYRATVGTTGSPSWLDTKGLLAQFGTRRSRAVAAYQRLVHGGRGGNSIWDDVKRQVFLGDDAFVERMQKLATRCDDINIQRPAPTTGTVHSRHCQATA